MSGLVEAVVKQKIEALGLGVRDDMRISDVLLKLNDHILYLKHHIERLELKNTELQEIINQKDIDVRLEDRNKGL